MSKMRRNVFLICFLVFSFAAAVSAEDGLRELVSPELLEHGKLKMLWRNELPLREGEVLKQLYIVGNRIYAISDRNYMISLNRQKGNMLFGRYIAEAGFPVMGLELYGDKLFSIIGGKLVEMDAETGTEVMSRRFEYGVVCPAARNSSYYYVVGSDKRLHSLRAEDKVEVFKASADNDSSITSLAAADGFVVFGTETGNVVSIMPNKPKRLWQFDASDGIAGQIVNKEGSLFIASRDTNVYKVNAATGELGWRYQTAAVLDRCPCVTSGVVYQYVRDKGMAAIDKENGSHIWELSGGVELLAEAGGKAYVITSDGKLAVMDNKEKKQLYSINFSNVSRYAANEADSKIYIADSRGLVVCVEPVE